MVIGSVKEIKKYESRVGLTPSAVKEYVNAGHKVLIETKAGMMSGFMDDDYEKAGATIVKEAQTVDSGTRAVDRRGVVPASLHLAHFAANDLIDRKSVV